MQQRSHDENCDSTWMLSFEFENDNNEYSSRKRRDLWKCAIIIFIVEKNRKMLNTNWHQTNCMMTIIWQLRADYILQIKTHGWRELMVGGTIQHSSTQRKLSAGQINWTTFVAIDWQKENTLQNCFFFAWHNWEEGSFKWKRWGSESKLSTMPLWHCAVSSWFISFLAVLFGKECCCPRQHVTTKMIARAVAKVDLSTVPTSFS